MYNVSHSGLTDEKVYTNHFNHNIDLVPEGLIILLVWMIAAPYIKPHHGPALTLCVHLNAIIQIVSSADKSHKHGDRIYEVVHLLT